jgi:mono/diheme cytochrome c family protein
MKKNKPMRNVDFNPGRRWYFAGFLVLALAGSMMWAAEKESKPVDTSKLPAASTNKVDFAKDIQPIFKKACLDCHGPDAQMGDYRLDKRDVALKGSGKGEVIIPGKSEKSPLIHYVAGLVKGMEMPPAGDDPLTKQEIALLRAWIDQGAKW